MVKQGLMSHLTQFRSFRRRCFVWVQTRMSYFLDSGQVHRGNYVSQSVAKQLMPSFMMKSNCRAECITANQRNRWQFGSVQFLKTTSEENFTFAHNSSINRLRPPVRYEQTFADVVLFNVNAVSKTMTHQ